MTTVSLPDVLPVVAQADDVTGSPQGHWTYAAYAAIPDDGQRYEIIGGTLYMAPAPGERHQSAFGWFFHYLFVHVQISGLGRVYGAPFDVRLGDGTVVQPDVLVVLDANVGRITPEGVYGPPDLVVEIASPGTATYDRDRKLHAYERGGVPEYWIADPNARTIEVFVAEQGVYRSLGVFQGQGLLPSRVVPNMPVRVAQFFA
jgi:Uma2 family endonuclease